MKKNISEKKGKTFSPRLFVLMMLICIIVWALAFPFIRLLVVTEISFITLTILRFFIVCITALLLLMFYSRKFSRLQKKDVFPIFLLGFFGVMVYHFGLNYGEQYVTAGAASLIIATIPVFSILLAVIFLKETLTVKKIEGAALALTGVVIISLWGTQNASFEIKYLSGALAILFAAIMGSVYTITGKKMLLRYSPLSLTLYAMLLGSLVLIPCAVLTPTFLSEVVSMSLRGWLVVLFLGWCSTIIGYVLWYVALEMKTASELSVYLYGIPVLSTVISFLMFSDRITVFFLLGGVCVITGLLFVNTKVKEVKKIQERSTG